MKEWWYTVFKQRQSVLNVILYYIMTESKLINIHMGHYFRLAYSSII